MLFEFLWIRIKNYLNFFGFYFIFFKLVADGDIKNCHGHTCPEGTVTCSSQTGNKDGSEKQLLTTVTCEGKDGKIYFFTS